MRLDIGEETVDEVQDKYLQQAMDHYVAGVKIYEAMSLASQLHKDQKYGKPPLEYPYLYHLNAASKVVESSLPLQYRNKAEILMATWLHDSLEDQGDKISYEIIKEQFGELVANIVHTVTDEKGEDGKTLPRKERAKRLYPKLLNNDNALIVKLADRIANVEFCITMASIKVPNLFDMYCKEYKSFRDNLYNKRSAEPLQRLWDHLDKLINNPNFFLR